MSYSYTKGSGAEAAASLVFHQKGMPLLASALLLRSLGLGQVDLAVVLGGPCPELLVIEVKSRTAISVEGPEQWVGERQRGRLRQACAWLGSLLAVNCRVAVHLMS